MRQYLFQIPFSDQLFPPDGWWLPGYGAMLLAAFLVVVWWGGRRAIQVGLPAPKLQDMAMVLFITGLVGARILYMMQYPDEYPDKSLYGLAVGFVSIWKGGLVVYGSIFGGFIGYLFFRHYVLKKLGINGWQLADVVAPLLAIGLAVGRLGCYLNGCCWGQVAIPECQPVPLAAELGQFPLLPAHARKQICLPAAPDARLPQICGLQTSTGFSILPDGRTIDRLEPGSQAAAAGLKSGDVVVQVNGEPNEKDRLNDLVAQWPKGATSLTLVVDRAGQQLTFGFTPRTVTFFPTQIYETISMVLMTFLMVSYQPFRRRDGMVMVAVMLLYAMHRFLNESIRIEPTYALGLTLSQWISVFFFIAGLGLWLYIRKTQPLLPPGPKPLGFKPIPAAAPS